MPKFVQTNEPIASRRRVYFDLRGTDGLTPVDIETGGQPEISIDGAVWTSSGIGTLNLIGHGRYYADLEIIILSVSGTQIETRYKSINTIETPGDSYQVVGFDPALPLNEIGDGSTTVNFTVEDTAGTPIEFVDVWITSDSAGSNVVAGILKTDKSGQVTFQLDPGTYYLWRYHPSYNFSNPQTEVII